jgi:hypothetical protein
LRRLHVRDKLSDNATTEQQLLQRIGWVLFETLKKQPLLSRLFRRRTIPSRTPARQFAKTRRHGIDWLYVPHAFSAKS